MRSRKSHSVDYLLALWNIYQRQTEISNNPINWHYNKKPISQKHYVNKKYLEDKSSIVGRKSIPFRRNSVHISIRYPNRREER